MRILAILAASVLLLPAGSFAQAAPEDTQLPPGIAWQPDYGRALSVARTSNRPIMVAFLMKEEPANEEIMRIYGVSRDRNL